MVGNRDTAVPIWEHEGLSFCQWVDSKVRPEACESIKCIDCTCLKCSRPVQEDTNCCSAISSCCSCSQNKDSMNCKCLECDCKQHFEALCSKINDWTCMKCAKDDNSSFNMCEKCNCCSSSSSDPITCPVYQMKVSNNLRNIAQCPGYPDHALCFTCSEDQGVNCCCHYIFCNRCGDPGFTYNDKIDVCTFRENSCCSVLFQILFCIPRFLCLACFGLCENNARCFYFTCSNCAYLVCCKCSDKNFCMKYSCLCFDCEKLQKGSETDCEDDLGGCKWACCVCIPGKPASFLNADIEISVPSDSFQTVCIDRIEHNTPAGVERNHDKLQGINEKFEIVDEKRKPIKSFDGTNRTKNKTEMKDLTKRKQVSKEVIVEYGTEHGNLDIESDTSEDEEELYQDVKCMHMLQGKLLKTGVYDTDSEDRDVENTTNIHGKLSKYSNGQYKGHDKCRRKSGDVRRNIQDKNTDNSQRSKMGILKSYSNYSTDGKDRDETEPFSIYNEHNHGEHTRSRKRAHFANEDEELIKELFPHQCSESSKSETTGTNRKRVGRRKRTGRELKCKTPRKIKTSSDESDIIEEVSMSKRKLKSSQNSDLKSQYDSSEDQERGETFKNTSRHALSGSNYNGNRVNRSRKRNAMNGKTKSDAENAAKTVEVTLIEYNSSDEEFPVERGRFTEEEMKLYDLDYVSDEETDYKMDKKNKSTAQRLKEMRQRRLQSDDATDLDT